MTIPAYWTVYVRLTNNTGSAPSQQEVSQVRVHYVGDSGEIHLDDANYTSTGVYALEFSSHWFSTVTDTPTLKFRVYNATGQEFYSVIIDNVSYGQTVDINIDGGPVIIPDDYRVYGKITNNLGLPIAGKSIEAYHIDTSSSGINEILLGTATTDSTGNYIISYDPELIPQLDNSTLRVLNLIVYAIYDGDETKNTKSSLIYNASKPQQVDLVVDSISTVITSEFENLKAALDPHLGTTIEEKWLNLSNLDDRLEYRELVAQTIGWSESLVFAYVKAELFAAEINIKMSDPQVTEVLNEPMIPEIIYPLLREQIYYLLNELLSIKGENVYNKLVQSINSNIVPEELESKLDSIINDWKKIIISLMIFTNDDPLIEDAWQKQLLDIVISDIQKQKDLITAYFDNQGTFNDFIETIIEEGIVEASIGEDIKFVFELYNSVDKYLPIVKTLYSEKSMQGWHTIDQLAVLKLENVYDSEDPSQILIKGWKYYSQLSYEQNGSVLPSDIPGLSIPEKIHAYAVKLKNIFKDIGDDHVFKEDMKATQETKYLKISTFMDDYINFDLKISNIDQFLLENNVPVDTFEEDDIITLKAVQRLYRITPIFSNILKLLAHNYNSALKISQKAEDKFIAEMESEVGGIIPAQKIYNIASNFSAELLFHVGNFHKNVNQTGTGTALPNCISTDLTLNGFKSDNRFPNWITLFGDGNKCSCEHCETILSPSAYFTDLMEFITEEDDNDPSLNSINKRRPDLTQIELTCPNTNKTLPYIDMVIEVLENAIVPRDYWITATDFTHIETNSVKFFDVMPLDQISVVAFLDELAAQGYILSKDAIVKRSPRKFGSKNNGFTSWIIEDKSWRYIVYRPEESSTCRVLPFPQTNEKNDFLDVFPEHYNLGAEDLLKNAVFPFNLPFNLAKEEMDVLLKERNVNKEDIAKYFPSDFSLSINEKEYFNALAYLNITESDIKVIVGRATGSSGTYNPWNYWGFDNEIITRLHRPDKITKYYDNINWIDALSVVPVFLNRTNLTYEEMLDLFNTQFVNNGFVSDEHWLHVTADEEELQVCNYNEYRIAHLDQDSLNRISCFLRLKKLLNWSFVAIDKFLMNVWDGQVYVSDSVLSLNVRNLYKVKKIVDDYKISVIEILPWWFNIDVRRDNRGNLPLFETMFLTDDPDSVQYSLIEGFINNPANAIPLSTLEINEVVPTLCKGLKITNKEWDLFRQKINWPILDNNGNSEAHLTLEIISSIYSVSHFCKSMGISIEWYYYLNEIFNNALDIKTVGVEGIVYNINKINIIKSKKIEAKELDFIFNHNFTSENSVIADDIDKVFNDICININNASVKLGENYSSNENVLIQEQKITFIDIISEKTNSSKEIITQLINQDLSSLNDLTLKAWSDWKYACDVDWFRTDTDNSTTFTSYLIPKIDGNYIFENSDETVEANVMINGEQITLGNIVSLKSETLYNIEVGYPLALGRSIDMPLKWRTNNDESETRHTIPNEVLFPIQKDSLIKIYKAIKIINGLNISYDILMYNTDAGILDFNQLPLEEYEPSENNLNDYIKLINTINVNNSIPIKESSLCQILLNNDISISDEIVAERTGWDLEEISFIKSTLLNDALSWDNFAIWDYVKNCIVLSDKLKISSEKIYEIFNGDMNMKDSLSLRNLLQAQYSDKLWRTTFKKSRDILRQKHRDALVQYICTHTLNDGTQLFTENELYAHFLIDVEMETDTLTSRIKQASSAIQLFVQRILLELEENLKLDDDKREQWKWVKNYRVWEANRKVFLYPENWIEPELRDDKTPFFKELEEELLKQDLSHENAVAALGKYLMKVKEVSELEIAGSFLETPENDESDIISILHVFGRTKGEPKTHYYRKFIRNSSNEVGYWTPWEKIDQEINSDVLIPVVFKNQLYLFWPLYVLKNDSPKNSTDDTVEKYVEIRLNWSTYITKNEKWTKPKISKRAMYKERVGNAHIYDESDIGESERFNYQVVLDNPDYIKINIIKDASIYRYAAVTGRIIELDRYVGKVYDAPGMFYYTLQSIIKQIAIKGQFKIWQNNEVMIEEKDEILRFGGYYAKDSSLFNNIASYRSEGDENSLILPRDTGDATILENVLSDFSIQSTNFDFLEEWHQAPFFYQTTEKNLFGQYISKPSLFSLGGDKSNFQLKFETFNHPAINDIIKDFRRANNQNDPEKIMNRLTQALQTADEAYVISTGGTKEETQTTSSTQSGTTSSSDSTIIKTGRTGYLGYYIAGDALADHASQSDFEFNHFPTKYVHNNPYPRRVVDFRFGSSFGVYNWELFFHIPLLIAERFKQDMKHEDALKWLNYIFDPLGEFNNYERNKRWAIALPDGARYWNFLPFFANKDADKSLMQVLGLEKLTTEESEELTSIINLWKNNPFEPHLIARYRKVAYQKKVVMQYLDTLVAWADQLFTMDTIESINEATQLYIMADEILGDKPQKISSDNVENKYAYYDFEGLDLDTFSNTIIDVENMVIGRESTLSYNGYSGVKKSLSQMKNMTIKMFYFNVPMNDKLFSYWDLISDRLFKIRNSMNIKGVKRQLALFQPPIDPGMLVKAKAAGLDLQDLLFQINTAAPLYRFNTWMQKSVELCNEVKSFGSSLLQAIEKRDSETLQLLRSDHEIKLLNLSREIKKQQINDAQKAIEGLEKSLESAQIKLDYYKSKKKVNSQEKVYFTLLRTSGVLDNIVNYSNSIAGFLSLIPQFHATFPPDVEIGGVEIAGSIKASASSLSAMSSAIKTEANMANISAGYARRWEDWQFQKDLASKEIEQLNKQVEAAKIKLQIAENDLNNHEVQIENTQQVREYMEDKFSNEELYNWMISQLSLTHKEIYKMAYELAKIAEASYQFELGIEDTSFIKFNYVDSLRKGLLAGEKLIADLKQMEISYLKNNVRDYEITKNISLKDINPDELFKLKQQGICNFELSEALFDIDFPGQYYRKIKSVKISIPCITGPNANVSAKLTLTDNYIRKNTNDSDNYSYKGVGDDRFISNKIESISIATSTAISDAGVFELNFKDERYLPFEGAGAISSWSLELPNDLRQFDYDTISDVIMHISYTAKNGDTEGFKDAVIANNKTAINSILDKYSIEGEGLYAAISLKTINPNILHELLNINDATIKIDFPISKDYFPYLLKANFELTPTTNSSVLIKSKKSGLPDGCSFNGNALTLVSDTKDYYTAGLSVDNLDNLELQHSGLSIENVDDVILIINYTASFPSDTQ